ncbi:hypothetical protein [Empedobacter brevis]
MKSFLFILTVVLITCRPLLPVVDYLVNYDRISNEYCINLERPELMCNGFCYLTEQVSKTVDDNRNDQIPITLRSIDYFIYQSSLEINEPVFLSFIKKVSTFQLNLNPQYQLKQQLQPPIG